MPKWVVEIDNHKIFSKHALSNVFNSLGCEHGFSPRPTEEGTLLYSVEGPDDLDQKELPEGVINVRKEETPLDDIGPDRNCWDPRKWK